MGGKRGKLYSESRISKPGRNICVVLKKNRALDAYNYFQESSSG